MRSIAGGACRMLAAIAADPTRQASPDTLPASGEGGRLGPLRHAGRPASRAASRSASIRLVGFATPLPAISKAVP